MMVFLLPLVRYEARTLNDNRRLETEKKENEYESTSPGDLAGKCQCHSNVVLKCR